eukprot:scpid111715/ scgid10054/ 
MHSTQHPAHSMHSTQHPAHLTQHTAVPASTSVTPAPLTLCRSPSHDTSSFEALTITYSTSATPPHLQPSHIQYTPVDYNAITLYQYTIVFFLFSLVEGMEKG